MLIILHRKRGRGTYASLKNIGNMNKGASYNKCTPATYIYNHRQNICFTNLGVSVNSINNTWWMMDPAVDIPKPLRKQNGSSIAPCWRLADTSIYKITNTIFIEHCLEEHNDSSLSLYRYNLQKKLLLFSCHRMRFITWYVAIQTHHDCVSKIHEDMQIIRDKPQA